MYCRREARQGVCPGEGRRSSATPGTVFVHHRQSPPCPAWRAAHVWAPVSACGSYLPLLEALRQAGSEAQAVVRTGPEEHFPTEGPDLSASPLPFSTMCVWEQPSQVAIWRNFCALPDLLPPESLP